MRDDVETRPVEVDVEVVDPATRAALPDNIAYVAIPALALAACGGGSGGGSPTPPPIGAPPPPPPVIVVPPTPTQSGRMLAQATMGSSKADIARVQTLGYDAWLSEQFGMARPTTHWDWLVTNGYAVIANQNSNRGFDPVMWRQFIASPDQLRQRVGLALLDLLVVSVDGISSGWNQFTAAAYVDVLWDNAFGNYRTLLDKISLNAAMGFYLTFLGNRKANPATGSVPDENYARELMQLFTLGVNRLNPDGSVQMSGGRAIETYTEEDVTGLARVFTGFTLDSADNSTPDRYRRPMIQNASLHETGVKTFLGTTIPAGTAGMESLRLALDAIFAHANVPPFVSKQLIQRLVTSNPSPAYVSRVAAVFTNNGSGVRGDLRATIRAILLDAEARDEVAATGTSFGKLREPVTRLTGWARAFGVNSPTQAWAFGDTSSSSTRLAQGAGHSPSVFNFFRPGYTPANTPIATAGLVAPEFQVTNELSVVAYINYMQSLIVNGAGDADPNYTEISALAANPQALVDEINLIVAGGQVSAATLASIRTAVESIATTATNATLNRVYTAILLVMASPEYITLK